MDEKPAKKPFSDSRWWDDPCAKVVICSDCKRFSVLFDEKNEETIKFYCAAFPDGIPYEILTSCPGERDITKECANGYKFEPKK